MTLRKGYTLGWMDGRVVALDGNGGKDVLPVFTTSEAVDTASKDVPIPPHGVLMLLEVWVDGAGRLKHATAGGGIADAPFDYDRLRIVWDDEPGFAALWARGIAKLRAEVPDSRGGGPTA